MFTAGAYDLPPAFHEQIRVGGKILFILKINRGRNEIVLLKKYKDHFQSIFSYSCAFVSMVGKYDVPEIAEEYPKEILNKSGQLRMSGLKIYKNEDALSLNNSNIWISRRKHSTFVWSLN